MLKNIPAILDGYRLMIVEAPEMKMRKTKENGREILVPDTIFGTDDPKYTVTLFCKKRASADGYRQKGEEIKVTLTSDPGSEFEEGQYVSLRNLTLSITAMPHRNARRDTGTEDAIGYVGWSFSAEGLTPESPHMAARTAA
jgi:hypothetical protein